MHDPTRPSTEERYSAAVEASDLQVLPTRCSVDYLIAAGFIKDGLGASLLRLRTEYDAVRPEVRMAVEHARNGAQEAADLAKAAVEAQHQARGLFAAIAEADSERERCKRQAAAREAYRFARIKAALAAEKPIEVERAALTAHALAMVRLKTLRHTSNAVYAFAVGLGARVNYTNAKALREIAPRALQLWLDPNCPHCDGRGFSGGFREVVRWCQKCDKTGLRIYGKNPFRMHRSETGHEFGRRLLSEMDEKCKRVEDAMRLYLHSQRGPDAKVSASEQAALQQRLADLRSPQAQED